MSAETLQFRNSLTPARAFLALLVLLGAIGCEPRVNPKEFGTPVYEESKLPGAGDPPISLDREPPADS